MSIEWLSPRTDMFEYAEVNGIQAITNPCNCIGGWRAGISKQCGERYPSSVARYKNACRNGLTPGKLFFLRQDDNPDVLFFPTKDDWREPSELSYIESGLAKLVVKYEDIGLTSLVIPPLGCGYGGLKWPQVKPLILSHLNDVSMDIYVIEKGN